MYEHPESPRHDPQPRDEDWSNALHFDMKRTDMGLNIDDLIPSKYLKQSDVGDDDRVVTIESVNKGNVAAEGENPDYKGVIKFAEFAKPMVANPTNLRRIAHFLGETDTALWAGRKVVLWVDPTVEYAGKITGGLRIKGAVKATTPRAQPQYDDRNPPPSDEVPF